MKLLRLIRSPKPEKKWRAVFETNSGREKNTDFGDSNMEDYTQHKSKERREAYRARHAKDLSTGDPSRAGYLSYYILWGDYTSVRSNLEAFKRKYNL